MEPSQSLKRPYRMGGWRDALLGQSVDARKFEGVKGWRRRGWRRGIIEWGSRPWDVTLGFFCFWGVGLVAVVYLFFICFCLYAVLYFFILLLLIIIKKYIYINKNK